MIKRRPFYPNRQNLSQSEGHVKADCLSYNRSNKPEVLAEEDRAAAESASEKLLEDPTSDIPMEKVLGVAYSFHSDVFAAKVGTKADVEVKTRRQMLSLIHSRMD